MALQVRHALRLGLRSLSAHRLRSALTSLGIVLGVMGGNLVASFVGSGAFLVPWGWMMVGLVICVGVGMASGYYPASKAAALDPIDSLRYE